MDVTVIVAVYNALPYLRECLDSLVGQTIGADRMEIVAVDDGSTDGGDRLLDEYARRHRNLRVLHQPNSGGPAAPSNRALGVATGRYVFFVGADDRLGREALQRLVAEADRVGADVVAGRMAGVNGRWVPTEIFARSDDDVDLYDSALPYAMSNTKLFRRSLLDAHGIRFPEELPFGSDQPFTLAACVHAGRISVLADYDYYYAVTRARRDNITFSTGHVRKVECTEQIMAYTAGLLPPGPRRDAVIARSFGLELWKLLQPDFVRLGPDTRALVCDGIARACDAYLTPGVEGRLDPERRMRLALARAHRVDELDAAIRRHAAAGRAPLVARDTGWYAAYPDAAYFVTGDPEVAAAHRLTVESAACRRGRLTLAVSDPAASGPGSDPHPEVAAGDVRADVRPAGGGRVEVEFDLRELLGDARPTGEHRPVSVLAGAGRVSLAARPGLVRRGALAFHRGRAYRVAPGRDADGDLVLAITPLTGRRVVTKLRQTLAR